MVAVLRSIEFMSNNNHVVLVEQLEYSLLKFRIILGRLTRAENALSEWLQFNYYNSGNRTDDDDDQNEQYLVKNLQSLIG